MTLRSLVFVLALLAALTFLAPYREQRAIEVRSIDEAGRDRACADSFAYVSQPARDEPTLLAFWQDFAYAAAAAGGEGCAALLVGVTLLSLVLDLWCRGMRCAWRRVLVSLGIGAPLCIAMIYFSCLLDGRMIELGPEAAGRYVRASLHTQTHHTTGMLSPKQLASWHYRRGFEVLNVSDKDTVAGADEARRYARQRGFDESMLVIAGEEWHGHPDLVLVNLKRAWAPTPEMKKVIEGVRAEGGASFVAHPWSKLAPKTLEQIFEAGADGVEVVNGVIHGGTNVIQKARNFERAMLGVIDYKFGPHVNALTLLPAELARTPRGVVEAIRTRRTRVLYAVPGGVMSDEAWEAGALGKSGAFEGLRTLLETPRARRLAWYPWLALITLLWWLATRRNRVVMAERTARILFLACFALQVLVCLTLTWQAREMIGPVPLMLVVAASALVALPMLAASHALAVSVKRAT